MIPPPALSEEHFTVKQIAQKWGMSPVAVRRLFRNEPGVLRFGREKEGHTRQYVSLRIPATVVDRVYRRCSQPGPLSSGKW